MKKNERIVLKIGSSSLTGVAGSGLNENSLSRLVLIASEWKKLGAEIIIVSSGAIAAGLAPLGLTAKPKDLATAQAAASVGQGLLIGKYNEYFSRESIISSQVLITLEDVIRRSHYQNVQRTLNALLEMGVVPIINENDSVGTHEIRMGDNDRIAALIAHLTGADKLVLITDVDGLYDRPPTELGARRISQVNDFAEIESLSIGGTGSAGVGSGGMVTKVEAARIATGAGIECTLVNLGNLDAALHGADVGTRFIASAERKPSRLFWLEHASTIRGQLFIDAGATTALIERGTSLLPVGVTKFSGEFNGGDTVEIISPENKVIARGVVAFDSEDLPKVIGKSTKELAANYGVEFEREIVHRDDLVMVV
jgi:glutamate 5-kinase